MAHQMQAARQRPPWHFLIASEVCDSSHFLFRPLPHGLQRPDMGATSWAWPTLLASLAWFPVASTLLILRADRAMHIACMRPCMFTE